MKHPKFKCGLLAALAMTMMSTPVFAHSDDPDGHESEIDYSDVEEHPFGKASNPMKATVTIEVEMSDQMRFSPSQVTINRGDSVRFVVKNAGMLMHEMVLGTDESLGEHAQLMKQFPGMEHDEPHMAHVPAGKTYEMGWQFTEEGEFYYACLIPGHYDAGMKGRIVVR